jgi:hypothetical protein
MVAVKKAPQHTKYANAKQHRIYLTPKGRPFTTSSAGKRSYGAKAKFVSSSTRSGSLRKITPGNMKNIPNAMRPSVRSGDNKPKKVSKTAGTRVRLQKTNSARATNMFAKVLNKTYKPPKAKAGARPAAVRKSESAKAATKAASKMMAAAKRAARKPTVSNARKVQSAASKVATAAKRVRKTNSAKATNMFAKILNRTRKPPTAKAGGRPTRARKARSNAGKARGAYGPQVGRVQRRMNSNAAKAKARGPDRRRKTASAKAATAAAARARAARARANNRVRPGSAVALLRKLVNAPARKKRSNTGKPRVMIASPGGSVYKGMAALTRAMKKRNM